MQPGVMRTRMCRAKKCFGDALDRAMQQRNGQVRYINSNDEVI